MELPSGHSDIAAAIAAKIMADRDGGSVDAGAAAPATVDLASRIHMDPADVRSCGALFLMQTWCGHCKRFFPKLEAVRKYLEGHGSPIEFVVHHYDDFESFPPHINRQELKGVPTILPMLNRVPVHTNPEVLFATSTAPAFLEQLRACFPRALEGVPPMPESLAGGADADLPIGFTPAEFGPMSGGRHMAGLGFGPTETKTMSGDESGDESDDESDDESGDGSDDESGDESGDEFGDDADVASLSGGAVLRRIRELFGKPKDKPAGAAPAAGAVGPSGGSVGALASMPLAARCVVVTMGRMPRELQAAFGPASGAQVTRAMIAPSKDGQRSVVVALRNKGGAEMIMAGTTPEAGCNTLDSARDLAVGAVDSAIAKFSAKHGARDVTAAVSDALGM